MGTARHGVGDIGSDRVACPGEVLDDLARAGANQSIFIGCSLSKASPRIGHAAAKLCGRLGGEPQRETGADACAGQ
jgi:hypothetical protein